MAIKVKVNIPPEVLAGLQDLEPPPEMVERIVVDVMRRIISEAPHVPRKYCEMGPATGHDLKPGWKIDD